MAPEGRILGPSTIPWSMAFLIPKTGLPMFLTIVNPLNSVRSDFLMARA